MFGAARVDAIDYDHLMQTKQSREYVTRFDWSPFFAMAAEMRGKDNLDTWRSRLHEALKDPRPDWYRQLGIEYTAPFDALAHEPPSRYDLIVSRSTLEHVPTDSALPILRRLANWVRPGGSMYHFIHLSDHRDIRGNPLAFLGADDDYTDGQFDLRGNRLRASDWRKLFAQVDGFRFEEASGFDDGGVLPAVLASRFRGYDPSDLATTHYSVWGQRVS
jgi:SAM-dependent methyltransferase